jgi:hypothetical protein
MRAKARYMPVEGEKTDIVDIGTVVEWKNQILLIDSHNGEHFSAKRFPEGTGYGGGHLLTDAKPLYFGEFKFFALTQEIEVGDEIWVEYHKRIGILKGLGNAINYEFEGDRYSGFKEGIFKVLGELSRNATWVKEGDEIEIREEPTLGVNGIYGRLVYEVKCPTCNTFH